MPELSSYDYAVVRVVPRVEREEFINAGIILYAREAGVLAAKVALPQERLAALAPGEDPARIRAHLDSFERICAGGPEAGSIGALDRSQRFRWLVAPRSTVIQTSPVHTGLCEHPHEELERLFEQLVDPRENAAP